MGCVFAGYQPSYGSGDANDHFNSFNKGYGSGSSDYEFMRDFEFHNPVGNSFGPPSLSRYGSSHQPHEKPRTFLPAYKFQKSGGYEQPKTYSKPNTVYGNDEFFKKCGLISRNYCQNQIFHAILLVIKAALDCTLLQPLPNFSFVICKSCVLKQRESIPFESVRCTRNKFSCANAFGSVRVEIKLQIKKICKSQRNRKKRFAPVIICTFFVIVPEPSYENPGYADMDSFSGSSGFGQAMYRTQTEQRPNMRGQKCLIRGSKTNLIVPTSVAAKSCFNVAC